MTYTMRTYRSSQLSYSPILASSPGSPELTVYNIVIIGEIARRGKEKNVIFNGVSENSASGRWLTGAFPTVSGTAPGIWAGFVGLSRCKPSK